VGAGRTELLHCLFGIDRSVEGTVRIAGETVSIRSPRDAMRAGLALVPEDRKQHGLLVQWPLGRNVTLPQLGSRFSNGGIIRSRLENRQSLDEIHRLGIRATGPGQTAGLLSGGNQQKVVIGKWLATTPRLLLLDEPTRGIDIGAKQEIYRLMEKLAREGMAILFVSSELEEIIGMSDRVLVMHDGRITGELQRGELNEESIMRLATQAALA
jgi:ribose transport system ATP-binding protein